MTPVLEVWVWGFRSCLGLGCVWALRFTGFLCSRACCTFMHVALCIGRSRLPASHLPFYCHLVVLKLVYPSSVALLMYGTFLLVALLLVCFQCASGFRMLWCACLVIANVHCAGNSLTARICSVQAHDQLTESALQLEVAFCPLGLDSR